MTPQQSNEINYYKDITAVRESLEKISKSLALLNKVIAALPSFNKVGYATKAAEESSLLLHHLSK